MRVVVYLPVRHERQLRDEGEDPAEWVRRIVKIVLERKEKGERVRPT